MTKYGKLTIWVVGLTVATAAFAVSVTRDYDTQADFSQYKTYAWIEGTPAPSTLTEERIRAAIDTQLRSKGMREVQENPDLWVVTHASVGKETRVNMTHHGYGGYRGYYGRGTGSTTVQAYDVPVGTLMIDLVDTSTKQLVWRAVAQGTLSATSSAEKREKKINKAAAKIFKKYPPQPEK
jgi:hypothetical protein